jgi:hypothetical protein
VMAGTGTWLGPDGSTPYLSFRAFCPWYPGETCSSPSTSVTYPQTFTIYTYTDPESGRFLVACWNISKLTLMHSDPSCVS